jgi:hypothetical protein
MISLFGLVAVWFAFSWASVLSQDQEEIRSIDMLQQAQEAVADPGSVVFNETESIQARFTPDGMLPDGSDEVKAVPDSDTIIWMLMRNVASNEHLLPASATAEPPRVILGNLKLEEVGTIWPQSQLSTSSAEVIFRDSENAGEPERPATYKLQWFTHFNDLVAENLEESEASHLTQIPAAWPYELRWRRSGPPPPQPYELRWRK